MNCTLPFVGMRVCVCMHAQAVAIGHWADLGPLGRRRLAEAQLVQLDGRAKQWARALTEEVGALEMPLDRKGSLEPEIVENWTCARAVLYFERVCL